jgi:hypothetical protein
MRPLADNPVPPTELEVLGDAINEFAFACVNHSFKWVSAEIGEYIYTLQRGWLKVAVGVALSS